MKLKNKKTGEIVDVESLGHADSLKGKFGYQVTLSWKIDEYLDTCKTYNSLAELNEEWEDYEDPKEYWYVEPDGSIIQNHKPTYINHLLDGLKSIDNYFETREEAEKAVEKLKAWKRLKDKGFRFLGDKTIGEYGSISYCLTYPTTRNEDADLDLLFGGEE